MTIEKVLCLWTLVVCVIWAFKVFVIPLYFISEWRPYVIAVVAAMLIGIVGLIYRRLPKRK